jgi:nitrate reductase gamma subunit
MFAVWAVLPYLCVGISLAGHIRRFRRDRFQWSNRTIKAGDQRSLGAVSLVFHYGIIGSLAGHALGLIVPAPFTSAAGLDPHLYHVIAVGGGGLAGLLSAAGLALLMQRRLTNAHLRKRMAGSDGLSYALLGIVILLGLGETAGVNGFGTGYDYRTAVGPWVRGLLALRAKPDLMAGAPLALQAHAIAGLLLIAAWPFTRLVHAWSAPAQSLWKPAVYRSRFARALGTATPPATASNRR